MNVMNASSLPRPINFPTPGGRLGALPPEILESIFVYLRGADLLRVAAASKVLMPWALTSTAWDRDEMCVPALVLPKWHPPACPKALSRLREAPRKLERTMRRCESQVYRRRRCAADAGLRIGPRPRSADDAGFYDAAMAALWAVAIGTQLGVSRALGGPVDILDATFYVTMGYLLVFESCLWRSQRREKRYQAREAARVGQPIPMSAFAQRASHCALVDGVHQALTFALRRSVGTGFDFQTEFNRTLIDYVKQGAPLRGRDTRGRTLLERVADSKLPWFGTVAILVGVGTPPQAL